MDRARVFRWLRISASVVCLVVCGLLVALWARSYWREDCLVLGITDKRGFIFDTLDGVLVVFYINDIGDNVVLSKWFVKSYEYAQAGLLPAKRTEATVIKSYLGAGNGDVYVDDTKSHHQAFRIRRLPNGSWIAGLPFWLLSLPFTFLAVAPWIHWRFSLRTMLIVTTVIAALLGMVVWWAR